MGEACLLSGLLGAGGKQVAATARATYFRRPSTLAPNRGNETEGASIETEAQEQDYSR